jgi:hypothetical protein
MRGCSRIAFGVAVALTALPAFADWKDDYARGLEAVRDGRWGEAARLMDSAIAGNAQPAPRLRLYGQRYEVYAPQHYAGLAALRQGDCAGALRQWNQSANQTFVAANAGLADVEQRGRADCGSAVASQSAPASTTPRSDTPATKPAVVETRPETPATPPSRPPTNVPASPPVERPVVQTPPATTPPPTAAAKPPATAPITPTETRNVASAAAEALRPVLEAYLGGRYAEVLKLSAKPASDARVGWHLMTLRAAAAWQLSQVGDESADTAGTARQAVSEARRLDAKRRPDATFYSPRFIAFYDTL